MADSSAFGVGDDGPLAMGSSDIRVAGCAGVAVGVVKLSALGRSVCSVGLVRTIVGLLTSALCAVFGVGSSWSTF